MFRRILALTLGLLLVAEPAYSQTWLQRYLRERKDKEAAQKAAREKATSDAPAETADPANPAPQPSEQPSPPATDPTVPAVPVSPAAEEPRPPANQSVLNVRNDGTVVMDQKPLTLKELRKKLSALSKVHPDYAIILRSEKQLPYQKLLAVMDVCRQANIANVAFAIAETPPPIPKAEPIAPAVPVTAAQTPPPIPKAEPVVPVETPILVHRAEPVTPEVTFDSVPIRRAELVAPPPAPTPSLAAPTPVPMPVVVS